MVHELLLKGPESAVPLRHLTALLDMDERSVRAQIARERKSGHIIISDNEHGYFLPSSAEEIRRFSRSMNHRAKEILTVAQMADDALAKAEGQERIEGW
jgi:biotin operon repressor